MPAARIARARLRSGYAEQDRAAQHEPLLVWVGASGLRSHGPVVRRNEPEDVAPLGDRLMEKRCEQSGRLGAGVECAEAEPAIVAGRPLDQLRNRFITGAESRQALS